MLHKPIHRALEENDAEARTAVRDAIAIVAELSAARQQSIPKNIDQRRQRDDYIAEKEQDLALIASRGNWDPKELEQVVRIEVRQLANLPEAKPARAETAAVRTPGDLLLKLGVMESDIAALERERDALDARIEAGRNEAAKLRRRAFAHRRPVR